MIQKIRFFGCAKKTELQQVTDKKILELSQYAKSKTIKIRYNTTTIAMLKKLTDTDGTDQQIFDAFIKKVSNEYDTKKPKGSNV